MRTDLHIHTVASDGTWQPERLVAEIKKEGIGIFAVTDHDATGMVKPTQELAVKAGLCFIPGVEISSTLNGDLYHILAYGIDLDNMKLQKLLENNCRLMNKKDDDSIRMLVQHGYKLDLAKYEAYENDAGRGGWKALNFLIDEGLCRDAGDFFRNLFQEKHQLSFPTFPSPREVIEVILQAGGLPVLAHPGVSLCGKQELEAVLEAFYALGIQGIECYHSLHDADTTERCCAFCREKGLQITGGSDCHGDFIPSRKLGVPHLDDKTLRIERILNP